MELSLIIPIAKTDAPTLKKNLPYIKKNMEHSKLYIIGNKAIREAFSDNMEDINFIDEDCMYNGMSFSTVRKLIEARYPKAVRRTGWYFQQFLKLAFSYISETEYYLTWDSDTIPLHQIEFFNQEGLPYLDCRPYVSEDEAYFDTIRNLWSDGTVKKCDYNSYITEHMIFSSTIVKKMLGEIEQNCQFEGMCFYEKIINAIPKDKLNLSGFSEFETYATYLNTRHRNCFELRRWHNLRHGKVYFGSNPSQDQLDWAAKEYDVVSIEDFDKAWIICKTLCNEHGMKKRSFKEVSRCIEPLIGFTYKVRLTVRTLVRG